MNAGRTRIPVGTRIEVVGINSTDPDEQVGMVGMTGEITHPFGGYGEGKVAGVHVRLWGRTPPGVVMPGNTANLCRGDRIRREDTGRQVTLG